MTQQPSWPGQPGAPVVPPTAPPPGSLPPGAPPPVLPPARAKESWTPERMEPVPGTEFGLVQLHVPPITSGLAAGSLAAGVVSILVSLLVLCFGFAGAGEGWGVLVGGAFTLLSVVAGVGAAVAGTIARRQIRRSGQEGRLRFTGGGVALSGIICGAGGAGISVLVLLLVLLVESV